MPKCDDLEPQHRCRSFTKAVLLPDNRTVRDPYAIVTRLVEAVCSGRAVTVRRTPRSPALIASERITGVRLEDAQRF